MEGVRSLQHSFIIQQNIHTFFICT